MASAWDEPPTIDLVGLYDVGLPLAGADRFAAQKGADHAMQRRLAARLATLGQEYPEAARLPGAGAAGGLGFGLVVWGGATLVAGAPWVLDRLGFAARLDHADLVIVTEGAFDATSLDGKLSGTVLQRARAAGRRAGLVTPAVWEAPPGVLVEAGGGEPWDAAVLARHTAALVRRVQRA
jgi:glycerate kinase